MSVRYSQRINKTEKSLTPNDMKFINKAERYIEVKNLLESYTECLENENSFRKLEFGQKKSVQLLEAIFNNQIIGLRLVFDLRTISYYLIVTSATIINELANRSLKNHKSKWEQTIFSDFLKNESEWMKRAKVDSGTIRAHFGDGPRRKFGREWVYPIEFYVEHALNLRKCSKSPLSRLLVVPGHGLNIR